MLITRYLMKNLLAATIFVALTLTMVIWLTQSLKLLELVANSDAPPWIFIKLVALTLPRFLEIILPLSLVAAILFVYHKFIMDNELIVLRACGFDQINLAKPALILAGALLLILWGLSTYISPRSYAEMHLLRQTVQSEYSSFLVREGVFNTFGKDLTVYVRKREENGDLTGLMIHDTRDRKKPPVTVMAKKGRLAMQDNIPQIIVFEGMRQQPDPKSGIISKLYFSRYTIEIKGFDNGGQVRWKEPSERTLIELFNPDNNVRRDRNSRDVFMAEAHHRIVTPLNVVGFSLVALAAVLLGPFNRRGQSRKIAVGTILIVALQAANLAIVSLSKKHIGVVPALYALTILPVIFGFFLLQESGERRIMRLLRLFERKEMAAA